VERGLSDAQAVLDGTKKASPQQVALFLRLLAKVLPRTRKAPNEEPATSWVGSLTVADLRRLLAETLGEAPPAPAPAPPPTKAELAAERERKYQQDYERRHPELRQRRAAANARRYASVKKVAARIRARKATQPPDKPWTREHDGAARSAMRAQVAKEKRREAERQARKTMEIMSAQDRLAARLDWRRDRYAAGQDGSQDRYFGTCAERR
jgi:hypothetical protein